VIRNARPCFSSTTPLLSVIALLAHRFARRTLATGWRQTARTI
jgi:hypothetical protein